MNKFLLILSVLFLSVSVKAQGFTMIYPTPSNSNGIQISGSPNSITLTWSPATFMIPGTVFYQVNIYLNGLTGPLIHQTGLITTTSYVLFLTNPPFERNPLNPLNTKKYHCQVTAKVFGGENGTGTEISIPSIFYLSNNPGTTNLTSIGNFIKMDQNLFGEIHKTQDSLGLLVKNTYSDGLAIFEIFKSGGNPTTTNPIIPVLTYFDFLEKGENKVKIPLVTLNAISNPDKNYYVRFQDENGKFNYILIKLK